MAVLFRYKPKWLLVNRDRALGRFCVLFPSVVVLAVVLFLSRVDGSFAASEAVVIVPSRQVEQLHQDLPEWKRSWDTARRMVLAGDFPAAAAVYQSLLVQRPALEEARWELAEIYIRLQDWGQAVSLLERLLDGSPDRCDYLNALARVMAAQKHWGRAIELFARVIDKAPGNVVAVDGMVKGLLALDRPAEALPYLERAYRQEPANSQRRLSLADLAYRLGNYELARPHLVALASADDASGEILLKAARLHEKLGLQNLAVNYWQRLLQRKGNHSEAHRHLAAFFEKTGRFNEALPHLLALNRLVSEDASLWLRIGKALVATSRGKEALSYLDRYVASVPDDIDALELLVNLYATQGEKAAAAARLDRFFTAKEPSDLGRVKQAARLYEAAGRYDEAVVAYRHYLALAGSDHDAELALAANLRKLGVRGRFEALAGFAEAGPPSPALSAEAYRLMIASAYAGGGMWHRALADYQGLLSVDALVARQAFQGLSDLYQQMGMLYESEQALRQALLLAGDPEPVLLRLFNLAILAGNVDDAEIWQQRLAVLEEATLPSWRAQLVYVRLQAARGHYGLAIRICRRLLAALTSAEDGTASHADARMEVREALAGFAMEVGDYATARRQLEKILAADHSPAPAGLVLLQQVYERLGLPDKAENIFLAALSEADRKEEGLLRLAALYHQRGMVSAMGKVAVLVGQRLPDAPRAVLLEAEAYRLSGQVGKAEQALKRMVERYHGESGAAVRLLHLLFGRARFAEALALCERTATSSCGRPDALLLKARILWALDRRPEAIRVYETFLTPSVAERMGAEIDALGIVCPPLVSDPTLWQIVTLRGEEPSGFIDTMMSAEYAAAFEGDSSRHRLHEVAARHYARYRWQKRFFNEFTARRAVQRKEFFYAVRQYQAALRDEPASSSLLFDLAGVYSRLGWLGKEAGIYEELAARQVDFPDLAQARQRNLLKRKPLTAVSYGYQKEDGWEGYKNISRDWQEVSLHLSPWNLSRHELDLSMSRQRYRPIGSDAVLRTNRALFSYSAGLTPWLSGRVGAGLESPTDDAVSQTGLLQGSLACKFGDKVTGEFSYDRDLVADTLPSLTRNVVRQTLKGGTALDLLPRLRVGANYSTAYFSDGNAIRGYDFWSSYLLFTEPHSLQLRYMYDFKDSREGNLVGAVGADGFAADDHPYWAPQNYWLNRFVVSYRQQLSEEILDRGGPTYYTAEYSIDYDSKGHQFQTIGGGLFYEWSAHFLVEAAASLTSSDLYRRKDVSLSLLYRW